MSTSLANHGIRSLVLVMGAVLAGAGPAPTGTILHVDADAPAGGDGLTWTTAYRFLQDALATAETGGISEIRVADGTYTPDRDEANPEGTGDRGASFGLVDGVGLRGGYAGLGAPDPDARDIVAHETILSGDLLGNDGPGFAGNGDNSRQVVKAVDVDAAAVIDGFTITAGKSQVRGGGGLFIDDASPTVVACALVANVAETFGAGLRVRGASAPSIVGCRFEGNWSGRDGESVGAGGGALVAGQPTTSLVDCEFVRNHAGFRGGGLQLNGPATLTGCVFRENTAEVDGGGVVSWDSAVLRNCTFIGNVSDGRGGGFLGSEDATTTLSNCTFERNEAIWGGGFAFDDEDGTVTIEDSVFRGNTAHADGGGVYVRESWPGATITGCVFEDNTAGAFGGGMLVTFDAPAVLEACTFRGNTGDRGGGLAGRSEADVIVSACVFEDNEAVDGGGVYGEQMRYQIDSCTFRANRATQGGGISAWDVRIDRSVFLANQARSLGGAVSTFGMRARWCTFGGNTAGAYGGAVYGDDIDLTSCLLTGNDAGNSGGAVRFLYLAGPVVNCTFNANTATFGGAISSPTYISPLIANSILWGSDGDVIDGPASVTYSNVEGGMTGVGNIDADPRFVDADGPDGVPGTADDDLRLRAGSPCIDAGDNTAVPEGSNTDLDGEPRFRDDPASPDTGNGAPPLVDHGAYEYHACAADLDDSGTVDVADLLLVLAAWGPCAGCPEDLDGSDTVDVGDLLLVLAAWGACP